MKTDKASSPGAASGTGSAYHQPVMLREAIDMLAVKPGGTYVDCTYGGGGHSKEILHRLDANGRLLAFDQDSDAQGNAVNDSRFQLLPHNFRHLHRFLRLHKALPVDGVLADLGVSSFQLDQAERGFSTRFDAALDMRMDNRQQLTAYSVLQTYSAEKLHKLFEQYGEVTNARTLANTIVALRRTVSLQSVSSFKTALYNIVKGNPNKYFAQVFQALRIEVNDELGALRDMLEQLPQVLKPGGRAVIITFHSLEDRLVKNFFKRGSFAEEEGNPLLQQADPVTPLRPLTRKPLVPSEEEQKNNARSRSAKLRAAERTGDNK